MINQQHYYKSEDTMMILAHSPDWEYRKLGIRPDGRGDEFMKLLWEGLWAKQQAIEPDDTDLEQGAYVMYANKIRWTDGEIPPQKGVNSKGIPYKPFRSVFSVTRDYIIGLTMYFHFTGNHHILKEVHYPRLTKWYRMTSGLYHWHRFLIDGRQRSFSRYERLTCRSIRMHMFTEPLRKYLVKKSHKHDYQLETREGLWKLAHWFGFWPFVKFLHAKKAYTIGSEKVKRCLLEHAEIPRWNYAIRVMCNDRLDPKDLNAIQNYQDCEGFQWGMEEWETKRDIPKTDTYQVAAHCLAWLMGREYSSNAEN